MNGGNSHKSSESFDITDATEDLLLVESAESVSRNEGASTAKAGVEAARDLVSPQMDVAGAVLPPIGSSAPDYYEDATESLEVMTEFDAESSNNGSASAKVGFHAPPGFPGPADMRSGNAFLPKLPGEI